MSYNIIRVHSNGNIKYKIKLSKIIELHDKYEEKLPEINMFDDIDLEDSSMNEFVYLDDLSWCGIGSGAYYDNFIDILNVISKETKQHVDITIVWESGDIENLKIGA